MARIGLGSGTSSVPVQRRAPKRVPVAKSPVFGAPTASSNNFSQPRQQAAQKTTTARRAPVQPYVPRVPHPTAQQRRTATQIRSRAKPLPLGATTRYPIRGHAPMAAGILRQQAAQQAKRLVNSYGPVDYSDPLVQYLVRTGLARREEKSQFHIPILQNPAPVYKSSGHLYPTDELSSTVVAPAVKALAQTTRLSHAIAEASHNALTGGSVTGGFAHGLTRDPLKGGVTFSDVAKDVGVHNKALAGIAGFAGDVAFDPTTYLTAGAGSVAEKAAVDAARGAERKALAAGLTREQAVRFGQRAAAQASRQAAPDAGRGAFVQFAGRELPGVRRATARAGATRPVQAARATAPVRGVRSGLSDLNPGIAPEGMSAAQHAAVRGVTREARASAQREISRSRQMAVALSRRIPKEHYQRVIDAIEANDLSRLPAELRAPAKRLQDQFRYTLRLQRQAGIARTHELVVQDPVTHAQGYFPHALDEALQKGQGFQGRGARQITVDANRGRANRESLAELRKTQPGLFSENVPLVFANRLAATHRAVAKAELNRNLAEHIGRPARAGETLAPNEQIFKLQGSDLKPVDRLPAKPSGGRYVVLDKHVVEQAHARLDAIRASGLLRGYDRVQGGFKRIATGTIGFHVRNLVGDLNNAYIGQPARHLAVNLAHSRRIVARVSREEAQLAKHLPGDEVLNKTTRGVKIKGTLHTYDQLAHEAERVGAIRQGYIGRELEELGGADRGIRRVAGGRGHTAGVAVKRWMQNREDLVRLATYIGARKRGLAPREAAAYVAKYHFDYGDLTSFERNVARRAMPFYTFSARNIPLQTKSLITRPGKYATYQKLLEESSKAFGFQPGFEGQLSEYDQRNVGIPVRAFGGQRVLSASLPLTDLNEFPTTLSPAKLGTEYARRFMSLVTPLVKNPLELGTNYSFFFRRAIESPNAPLVPAPAWVQHIPAGERAKLGIVPDLLNKRTGQKSWGWPGKLNYIARMIPGAPAIVQNMLTESSRAGQTQADKMLGAFAGVRSAPFDQEAQQQSVLNALYAQRDKLNRQRSILNQRGIYAANSTPEYQRVSQGLKQVGASIVQLRQQRGDKVISGVAKRDPLAAKYGIGGGSRLDQLSQKYGVAKGPSVDQLAAKYGVK